MKFGFRDTLHCLALILTCPLLGQDAMKPIAQVNGQAIYERDLMPVAGPKLLELRDQEYKLKNDALTTVIRKKLIDIEAKRRGLTVEELLRQDVDSKVAEPSDDEAKGYYLAVKSGTTLPFDQVRFQIKQLLKNDYIQEAREKYADSLRDKAHVSILLQPSVLEVGYDANRVKGKPDAPVTIVEFADFQCPFCKKTENTLNELLRSTMAG